MKFSIITPTHSTKNFPYLIELYESLLNQSYEDWEWVLYLNNGVIKEDLPEAMQVDDQVKVYEAEEESTKVGAIKKAAFALGTGDVLVEVDHDDMLAANCLHELNEAFQDPEIGFAYSDSVTYRMDGKNQAYNPAHGWTYKTFKWRGKDCISHNHFGPSAQAMSYIWYAPDHVRAWRASEYHRIGGHNPDLEVCDDHELCIRTYLHTKMKFIPKPLYIYRVTGDNTWLERNKLIQTTTKNLFNHWARRLAEKDAQDRGLLKVDLGGGLNPFKDYKTIDVRSNADYVADLNNGIPLEDNSVGVLHAYHILEHLKDPIFIMSEIHRVLAHGGWAFIEVPSTDGRGAFQDPTHVTYWNQNSFFYYTRKDQARFIDNTETRFMQMKLNTYYPNKWMADNNISVVSAVLCAVKDDSVRYPGLLEI